MTSEMFQRKIVKFAKEGRDRISNPEDIGADEIKKFVAIIKEFVSDLDKELQNVVNGKMSNHTCLLVAACLEDLAKHIRSFDDAVRYAPNQAYIGNLNNEELKAIEFFAIKENFAINRHHVIIDHNGFYCRTSLAHKG
jgi:hypothetical protein